MSEALGMQAPAQRRLTSRDAWVALAIAVFTTAFAWNLLGGRQIDWQAPLQYAGDSILHLVFIKRLMDGHGYFLNSAAGFPFSSSLYDFPGSDGASLIALWLIAKVTGSASLAHNIYYLIGFPAAALSSYFVLRSLSTSRVWAAVFSILFAYLSFHFFRLAHLYYTWYFIVPIFVWYGIKIAEHRPEPLAVSSVLLHGLALVVLASFGVYYAIFGALVIGLSGIYGALKQRELRPLVQGVAAVAFVAAGVVANLAPNLAYFSEHGRNTTVAHREARESEIYGLKISQLLLPRSGHRAEPLESVAREYAADFPNVNENAFASLGIAASIGFLLLVYAALTPARKPVESWHGPYLGFLVIVIVMVATVGGFSALFAQLISPQIRAWNRISIFIAFISLAGLAMCLDRVLTRRSTALATLVAAAFLVLGLWDQTAPADDASLRRMQSDYRSDQRFIQQVEASKPAGNAIYQLPFMQFPESPHRVGLGSYDLAKGYLHSENLRWSFGVAAGRGEADFYQTLANQPAQVQLEIIRFLGFGGIYIDRRGYADHGAALESAFRALRPEFPAPITDDGGNIAYYPLPAPSAPSPALSNEAQRFLASFGVTKAGDKVTVRESSPFAIDFTQPMSGQVKSASGIYGPEGWGAWSQGKSIKIQFKQKLPKAFRMDLFAKGFGPNVGAEFKVTAGNATRTFTPTDQNARYPLDFEVSAPTDTVTIEVPHAISPQTLKINEDPRMIGLGLEQMQITPSAN